MSRLGLLWIVTRKCSHNLWDRERRQTETGGWHVMMWGVLTQLSTRLSTFTFYSKGCHPFRRQHSLSSRDRLTVNYLHFGYWNLIIIDNVSMKWSWMKFRCNITFHYSPLPSGGKNHTSRPVPWSEGAGRIKKCRVWSWHSLRQICTHPGTQPWHMTRGEERRRGGGQQIYK